MNSSNQSPHIPKFLETREGFFDMTLDDSADDPSENEIAKDCLSVDSSNGVSEKNDLLTTNGNHHTPSLPLPSPPQHNNNDNTTDERKSLTERIINRIQKRVPDAVMRRILKCTLAYFISTLFSTIRPIAKAIGPAPHLICVGCLLSHPGRTVGAQLDTSLTSILGCALAIVYSLGGIAAATTYNAQHPDSHAGNAINCAFLAAGVFGAQLLRQKFARLYFFSLQFMLVILFVLTSSVGLREVPMRLPSDIGLPFVIGAFVSLLVNVIFWPETAGDGLGQTLIQTLRDSKNMLDIITKQFFLDPASETVSTKTVDRLAQKMRGDMAKVHAAYREAKFELSYAYLRSSDIDPIRHSLDIVTKQLSILGKSLKSEQVLFKDEFSSEEDDSLSSLSDSNSEEDEEEEEPGQPTFREEEEIHHPHRGSELSETALSAATTYLATGAYPNAFSNKANDNNNSNYLSATSAQHPPTPDTGDCSDRATPSDTKSIRFQNPDHATKLRYDQRTRSMSSYRTSCSYESSSSSSSNHRRRSRHDRLGRRLSMPVSLRNLFSSSSSPPPPPPPPPSSSSCSRPGTPTPGSHKGNDDYCDTNQSTVSSLKAFLKLDRLVTGSTLPKPPARPKKRIGSEDRKLLVAYLERLRDPLISLAVECGSVLECIRESLCDPLDVANSNNSSSDDDDDDDESVLSHTSFWRYLLHVLQIKPVHSKEYKRLLEKRQKQQQQQQQHLCTCADELQTRLQQFDACQEKRMKALYSAHHLSKMQSSSSNSSKLKEHYWDVSVRDELFLVFFFIFTLREIATHLQHIASETRRLQEKLISQSNKSAAAGKRRKRFYWPQITVQTWRKWFYSTNSQGVQDRGGYSYSFLQRNMDAASDNRDMEEEYRLAKLSSDRSNSSLNEKTSSSSAAVEKDNIRQRRRRRRRVGKSSSNDDDDNVLVEELETGGSIGSEQQKDVLKPPLILRIRYKLWLAVRRLQTYEFRFAVKLSAATAILTIPAWLPEYQDWFFAARGQWAALTAISIMSPTSGGTLSAGLWRLAATIIGALYAWAVVEIDATSGVLLSGCAVLLALPFFYFHFSTSFSKVTIITLVTYVVIALSQYVTPIYPEKVYTMVWHRTMTLIVGLSTSLVLNWFIWPFIAREAVRKTLASTIGELGDYFSFVMGTFLYHDEHLFPTQDEFKEAETMERKLEETLSTCDILLELTGHEPRLKGPFPKEFYREMIASAHKLLDDIECLRIVLMKMLPAVKKTVRDLDTHFYRRDMVASMLLHFYTLSTSLRSKTPLPAFMPSARAARLKVLRHCTEKEDGSKKPLLDYGNLTWFAMSCSVEETIQELEHLTDLVRFVVGESKFTAKARRLQKHKLAQ